MRWPVVRMLRNLLLRNTAVLTLALAAICGSAVSAAERVDTLGDRVEAAQKSVQKGLATLARGRVMVEDGETMVREGESAITQLLATGQWRGPESHEHWQAALALIRRGNDKVAKGQHEVVVGQGAVRQGRVALERAAREAMVIR